MINSLNPLHCMQFGRIASMQGLILRIMIKNDACPYQRWKEGTLLQRLGPFELPSLQYVRVIRSCNYIVPEEAFRCKYYNSPNMVMRTINRIVITI